uniref:Phosphoinositide phospholipase C n=2 Tax=Cyprinus carpio TaxID=7962 RepID=A0A8C1K786_CYPCA
LQSLCVYFVLAVERCMSVMQSGTQMVKLKNGSKGLVRLFYLDEHRSCIRWRPSRKSEKAKITIDSLYKVTEGRQSDIFHRHAEGNFDPSCCFTIYHGNHMESLDLVTSNSEEARTWVTGLRYLMAGISDEDSLWMKQTFEEADKNGDGLLNIEEIYQLLHKLNVNLPRRKVKQMFQEADTDDQQGTLTFEEFTVFYKMMSLRRDLYLLLMCFSEKKDHLTAEELGNFLHVEQKMSNVTPEYCLDIINKFEVSEENKQNGVLGIEGFTNYMRSPVCDVFNPQHNDVNQDMDQPLCNYFIASSHNTYLTGDQLLSHSKTDMYAWVLQAGCRCVEVDCWDGPDGEPMVQHGYTLTSKITFKSVIETINKYAFVNNEFPVILSIENHCNIQQQKKIAQHLKEIFGDKLDVGEALNKDPKQLPSPNSLKGKILIKGKRLPPYLSADAEEGEVSDDDSADEIEDDFKLKNSMSNGSSQHQVESHIRKKLDSLMKESQIGDKEDTDSFSIRALLRATHEGIQRNLRKLAVRLCVFPQRHSKSRLKCQSVETDDDGQQEPSGGQFNRCGRRRKTIKLSRDLSDLVVFTNSVASQECLDEGSPYNVLSFSETRAQHLVHHRSERFLNFNQRQLSRIYPSAYRIDSSNFNPQTYWNMGCQLVALNYQTDGRMMQLNRAKFMVNGGSGYVLKPGPMCKGSFNPLNDDPLPANPKKQLVIKIISGQQLPKPPDSMLGDRGEIIDPFVEVEIIGLPVDCCKEQTRVVDDNGFNPVWEETLSFTLHMPEVALVRFLVWDHDPIGRDFVGQRTVSFSSLMPGYRHVYLEGMTEASIFVHITVHDIYGKGRQLRGFRGLFNKSSKSSVDTHIGVQPRKRSITDHLLRRTASAPAKGRKKIKMPLTEATSDRKHSTGEPQTTCVEKRVGNRKALQHRPASMPLDKLLHSHLSLSNPDQEGPDPGADTVGVFLFLLTIISYKMSSTDSFLGEKPRSISCNGGSSSLSEVSHRELSQLEAPKKNILTPKAATYSLTSSSSSSSGTITKFSPRMTLPDQKSQVSLQDSALSRLIDAVSLENESDTCGSISALIGQFELTAEQSSLIPSNSQPMKNFLPPSDLLHLNTELSSTPLKLIQKSVCEVLSPVPTNSLCQTNFHNDLVGSPVVSKGSSPNKMTLEWSACGNLKQNYGSECHSTGSFRNFEFGGYRETSINSTASDRFLLCQDSASSSLMEVEINVDGDPLDNTLTPFSSFHRFKSVHSLNQTSPCHVQRLEPTHLHKPSYSPSPVHSYSTDTSPFHRHYKSPHQSLNSNYNMISVESQDSQPSSHNQAFSVPSPQMYNGLSPASSKSKSLGDLTSEDISCNFQSKYKSISRSFVTPAMKDQRRICRLSGHPKSTDPFTEQLRKLVTLENEDYVRPLPSCSQPIPKPLSVRLSSRSQSRVRHIASRARERQQEAFKQRPVEGAMEVLLRSKPVSSQNPPLNRHSTGSYITGYLDQLSPEPRGLPEGACTSLRYVYGDRYCNDDSVHPPDFSNSSEPEVFFLLRL